jgi:hypothetical protein
MKNILPLFLFSALFFVSGCSSAPVSTETPSAATAPLTTQPSWNALSDSKLYPKVAISYPPAYRIEDGTDIHAIIVIKSPTARLEIFQMKDFGGDRPVGFTDASATKEEIDGYVPKLMVNRHGYDVWVYYAVEDVASRDELLNILDTLAVKP